MIKKNTKLSIIILLIPLCLAVLTVLLATIGHPFRETAILKAIIPYMTAISFIVLLFDMPVWAVCSIVSIIFSSIALHHKENRPINIVLITLSGIICIANIYLFCYLWFVSIPSV